MVVPLEPRNRTAGYRTYLGSLQLNDTNGAGIRKATPVCDDTGHVSLAPLKMILKIINAVRKPLRVKLLVEVKAGQRT